MSPIARHILSLINRHLQLTVAAGVVMFALVFQAPGFEDLLKMLSIEEALKLLVLFGLPSMLLILGGRHRPVMDRVLSRTTATGVCVVLLLHTMSEGSAGMPIIIMAAVVVLAQVSIMRKLDDRSAA